MRTLRRRLDQRLEDILQLRDLAPQKFFATIIFVRSCPKTEGVFVQGATRSVSMTGTLAGYIGLESDHEPCLVEPFKCQDTQSARKQSNKLQHSVLVTK